MDGSGDTVAQEEHRVRPRCPQCRACGRVFRVRGVGAGGVLCSGCLGGAGLCLLWGLWLRGRLGRGWGV